MIKLTIPGRPISKSNFKLHNIHGQAWMPSTGKHSKYLAYENMIAGYINRQYDGPCIEEDLITVLKLYFRRKVPQPKKSAKWSVLLKHCHPSDV